MIGFRVYRLSLLIILIGIVFAITAQEVPLRYISSLKWSPDGEMIALSIATNQEEGCYQSPGFYDIRIINPISGDNIAELENFCSVTSVDFSPDGTRLASSSRVGIIGIWNLATYQREVASQIFTILENVEWSPDNERVLAVRSTTVDINNSSDLQFLTSSAMASQLQETDITDAAWSPDGASIVIGSTDGIIRFWDITNNSMVSAFDGHASVITSLVWNSSTNHIASADKNGTVLIWNPLNGTAIHLLQGHTDEVTKVVWRPDGQYLASASLDGTVRIWDAETGTQVGIVEHEGGVYALDWSPDGSQIAYGGIFDSQNPVPVIVAPLGITAPPTMTNS